MRHNSTLAGNAPCAQQIGRLRWTAWRYPATIALLLFSMTVAANGYFFRGLELVDGMREDDKFLADTEDINWPYLGKYYGFIMGVSDAYSLNNVICYNDGVTRKQVVAVVGKFLKANPERWNEPAAILVGDALTRAFTCP